MVPHSTYMIARYGSSTKRCIIGCGHFWLFLLVSIGCQPYHLPYHKIRAVPIATPPHWPTNHPLPTCRQMQTTRGKSWGLSRTELWLSALVQRDAPTLMARHQQSIHMHPLLWLAVPLAIRTSELHCFCWGRRSWYAVVVSEFQHKEQ